ncbi:MAG: BppU family phage baseplate upper protein [Cetobacterium sp.]
MRIFPLKLDVDNSDAISTDIEFKQYDFGTSYIYVQILSDGVPINLDNRIIVGTFKNAKKLIVDSVSSSLNQVKIISSIDGICKMLIPVDILLDYGRVECEVLLFDRDQNRYTSPRFDFNIEKSLYNHLDSNGELPSIDKYSLLTTLLVEIEKNQTSAKNIIQENTNLSSEIRQNENMRISNENERKKSMVDIRLEVTNSIANINNTIDDVSDRFSRLTSQQQQDAEVIDARRSQDGEIYECLNDRLNAIENKPYILFETVEG